ncbi:MAG: response regulator, partial [Clostridia bacterium]
MYRVLIVDDEGVIRNGIIHLIDWKALGCEVVGECTHGQEVLAFLAKQEADICVCDVKMP